MCMHLFNDTTCVVISFLYLYICYLIFFFLSALRSRIELCVISPSVWVEKQHKGGSSSATIPQAAAARAVAEITFLLCCA